MNFFLCELCFVLVMKHEGLIDNEVIACAQGLPYVPPSTAVLVNEIVPINLLWSLNGDVSKSNLVSKLGSFPHGKQAPPQTHLLIKAYEINSIYSTS